MRIVGKHASLLAFVTVLGVTGAGQTQTPEEKKPVAPPLQLEFSHLKPEAVIYLSGPHVLSSADDSVWVLNRTAGSVARVEAKTGHVTQMLSVGKEPCAGA